MISKRALYAVMLFLVGFFALSLTINVPTTRAIGEVTPTPAPDDTDREAFDDLLDDALSAAQANDWDDVIVLVEAALAIRRDDPEPFFLRGIAYQRLGDAVSAVDDFTQAIERRDYVADYYIARADAYFELGDAGQAGLDVGRAIEINPRFAAAFQRRAILAESRGRANAARVDELIAQGIAQWNGGNNAGAIDTLSQAIDVGADFPELLINAYYNRSLAHYFAGDMQAAIDDNSSALEIDPDMHDAYLARGIAYRESDDLRSAGADFLRRIELVERASFNREMGINEVIEIEMAFGNVYRVRFEGTTGQTLNLIARDVEDDSVADPLMALLNPEGDVVAGDDDFGGNLDAALEDFTLTMTGTYTLVVSHANGGFDGVIRVSLDDDCAPTQC